MSKKEGLTIDWETADRITVSCLTDSLKYVKKDVKMLEKAMKKGELGAAQKIDYTYNVELKMALERVLKYYGG